jgi:hypothetical protein
MMTRDALIECSGWIARDDVDNVVNKDSELWHQIKGTLNHQVIVAV